MTKGPSPAYLDWEGGPGHRAVPQPFIFYGFGSTISRPRRVRRSSAPGVDQRAKDQSFQSRPSRLDEAAQSLRSGPMRGRKDGAGVRRRAENVPHGDAVGTG